MTETILRFSGAVQVARGAPPLGLMLEGSAGTPAEPAVLAFAAAAPAELPATLGAALIEQVAPASYRIVSEGRAWRIEARAVHVHFEVAAAFYRALPPRRVPLAKRLLLRVLLALAASRAGLALLVRLRR